MFELPPSSKPWKMQSFGTAIILINEEHEPLVFADGKLQPLDLVAAPKRIVVRPAKLRAADWMP